MSEQIADLFRIEAGLLAFILAFYALCARERKAPYITHTVYGELGLVLLAVLVTLLSLVSSDFSGLSRFCRAIAQLLLLAATAFTIKRVYSIANRDLRLRDDEWWRMLPGFWQYYIWKRRRKHEKRLGRSYEFQSLSPSDELVEVIDQAGWRRT